MAKNRKNDGRGTTTDSFPGEEGRDDVRDDVTTDEQEDRQDDQQDDQQEEKKEDVPVSDRNRVERALMHLDFIEKEFRGLIGEKSELAGLVRRAAGAAKQQFDGDVSGWPPLKTMRVILETVRGQVK